MEKKKTGFDKLKSNIKDHGLHVSHVMEDENGPPFSYSIGLFHTYNHPEIIIVGLAKDLAHILINNIGFDIKEGKTYESDDFYDDILDDYKCFILKMDEKFYEEYLGQAIRFYENTKFPVLQCVYPTISGTFPWEDKWPKDIKFLQPLLGEVKY